MRNEHGFTLIELLIVLGILAILVGVVAMSVDNINATAEANAQASERAIVQTAVDAYVSLQGVAATSVDLDCARMGSGTPMIGGYLAEDTQYAWTVADGVVSEAPCDSTASAS